MGDSRRHQAVGTALVVAQFSLAALCLVPVGPRVAALTRPLLGLVLLAAGGSLALLALGALGSSTRVHPVPAEAATLRTRGIYAHIRHPMYAAVLLACSGATLVTGRVVAAVGVVGVAAVLAVKSRFEDRLLAEKYGWQFAAYASRVPAVIPQPWRSRR